MFCLPGIGADLSSPEPDAWPVISIPVSVICKDWVPVCSRTIRVYHKLAVGENQISAKNYKVRYLFQKRQKTSF